MSKDKLHVVWDRREPLPESTPILQPGDRGWVLPGPWCERFPHPRAFTVLETHIAQAGYKCQHDADLIFKGLVFGWSFREIVPLADVPWHRRLYWSGIGLLLRVVSPYWRHRTK